MSSRTANILGPALLLPAAVAFAYPEGAPWGSADPHAAETCASCHYDYEPVQSSAALVMEGLPRRAVPGQRYTLRLRFDDDEARVSGFQLLATQGELTGDADDVESRGNATRSTAARRSEDGFEWPIVWRAPDEPGTIVTLYAAASAANDDKSAFGDRIHYREIRVPVGAPAQ